ncbi:MAG: TspO/MBR family protein [Bauldia sp.]
MTFVTNHAGRSWHDPKVLLGLVVALAACFATAAIGSAFTVTQLGSWYAALEKPSFNPPNAVFGPVWSVLYTLMAIAVWRVWWKAGDAGIPIRGTLALFAAQLVLNAGWSITFFGLESPGIAIIVIALLWLSIAALIIAFRRVDGWAALLMLPYLAWVSFATALNIAIWQLN